ncbi:hypothetical protein CCMA1212_007946 [Trichoderma ghanense]|uniref:Uncharacterized protein n=1 Tax=Trichoderma ghanense TaxID=65468 RepID=A0ABY2GWJ7_9HYPO
MGKVQQASTRPRLVRAAGNGGITTRPTLAPQTDGWHWATWPEGNDSHADEVDGDGDGSQEGGTYQQFDFRTIDCSVIYDLLDHTEEESDGETLDPTYIQQAVDKRIVAACNQRSYATPQDRDAQTTGETIGLAKLALLPVFPYPAGGFGDYVFHSTFIMALAETIDIVFLGTFSPVEENSIGCTRFAAWYSEAYRPKAMPVTAFQGLNRALPLKQACKPYGAFACSVLWSQSDTDRMIRVVRELTDTQDPMERLDKALTRRGNCIPQSSA